MKILIIKTGAQGDVLRTTTLLHLFKNDLVYWLTKENSLPLLENNPYIKYVIAYNNKNILLGIDFDLILSLDDDEELCKFVTDIKTKKLTGAYYDYKENKRTYTEESSSWFDMSVISKFGIERANVLKKQNKLSCQEHLFRMLGKHFNKESYIFNIKPINFPKVIVGIETRSGKVWPMKQWSKYEELAVLLKRDGYEVKFFEERPTLKQYIDDINNCGLIITGDTLAMHIGLALNKEVIALFGPTPAEEIFSYNRMKKIKAKTDCYCCYRRDTENKENCIDSISVEEVYEVAREI